MVKSFRTWLLLLLVILLPVRGAMSAAMLCLPLSDVKSETVVVDHHGGGPAFAGDEHAAHAHDGSAAEQKDEAGVVVSHDCNLCASSCSLAPLVPASPDLRHPQAHAVLNPAPSDPVPSFVSDGKERPPRTI